MSANPTTKTNETKITKAEDAEQFLLFLVNKFNRISQIQPLFRTNQHDAATIDVLSIHHMPIMPTLYNRNAWSRGKCPSDELQTFAVCASHSSIGR
jgi:hypothetical protein